MHVELYHNKQSKYPVGIDTFSLPPSPSGTSETQLIPQHIQITQPAKAI